MHICFITNEYPKDGFAHGGIGSFVKTLATALNDKEIKVSVVGINYISKNETEKNGAVTIYRLKKSKLKGLAWYFNSNEINKKIQEIHKKQPITIIEGSELSLAFIKKIEKIKYVIRLHGGHHFFAEAENRGINPWKGFQEKKSFKKADAFIAVSNYVKRHTENYLSFCNRPLEVIGNPIDTNFFRPNEGNKSENKIVFVGTLCEKKGIRQLIQAFSLVNREYPEVTLEIYGRDWLFSDGSSYFQMLREKELSQLGEKTAKNINFHGAIAFTDIPKAYASAAVCVFPSHMETLGLVALEAMAMKKAVVFTNKGPGPEVIINKKTGLLCNPHKPEDIANKIIWFLKNKEKTKKIVEEAREFVQLNYGLKNVVSQNVLFYHKIVEEL